MEGDDGGEGAAQNKKRTAAWLLGFTALAGGLALNSPKVRRLMTVSDVTTGRTPEYPDIQPCYYPQPTEQVFDAAVAACDALRWRVVHEDRLEHRLYVEIPVPPGFTNYLQAWITDEEDARAVMVRSHSRSGRGDLGANARHITLLQREMDRRLGGQG